MEGYPYSNYPESGDSSPHCRDIDGEITISWDETPQPVAARVKLMCSYGGRIQPRPHDNQLSYFGGETKILAVDRSIRFAAFITKLASLHGRASPDGICIKYQLPGEDLDALISVTNDEDLEHMMIEYDRLLLCSGKPAARLRLFLFPANPSIAAAAMQAEKKADRVWFMETLLPEQSVPAMDHFPLQSPPTPPPTLVPDFLSGILPPACFEAKDLAPENLVVEPLAMNTLPAKSEQGKEDAQQIAGETVISPSAEIQRQIQEIHRLQIAENQYHPQLSMKRNDSDEALARVYRGEYYTSGVQDKAPPPVQAPAPSPALAPAPAPEPMPSATLAPTPNVPTHIPAAYWTDQHSMVGGRFTSVAGGDQLPVYLFPASHSVYPSSAGQTYYAGHPPPVTFSRVIPPDAYHEMPALYAMAPPPPQQPAKLVGTQFTDGTSALRAPGMDAAMAAAYATAQVAYDSTGRAVFYPGGLATYPAATSVARNTEPKVNSSQIS